MPHVDFKSAFARLTVALADQGHKSWGRQQLLTLLAEVQAASVVDDDHHQQHLDRFAEEYEQAFRTASYVAPEAVLPLLAADRQTAAPMAETASPSIDPQGHEGEPTCQTPPPRPSPAVAPQADRRPAAPTAA